MRFLMLKKKNIDLHILSFHWFTLQGIKSKGEKSNAFSNIPKERTQDGLNPAFLQAIVQVRPFLSIFAQMLQKVLTIVKTFMYILGRTIPPQSL